MSPISGIGHIQIPNITSSPVGGAGGSGFGDILASTIGNIDGLQKQAASQAEKFMTGENAEIHDVALAGQQAELSFELGLQVRNKIVSAYQEVMKMQL